MKNLLQNTFTKIFALVLVAAFFTVITMQASAHTPVMHYQVDYCKFIGVVPAIAAVPDPTNIKLFGMIKNDPKPDNINYQLIKHNSLKLFINNKV